MSRQLDSLVLSENTPEQRQAARLVVCAGATDLDDARELLSILGLLEDH